MNNCIKGKGFHLLHLNVCSLWPKIDLIKQLLRDNSNIATLTLSETWLTERIPSELVAINDFVLYRNDRQWGDAQDKIKKGGGLGIHIKEDYNVSEFEYQHLNESTRDGEFQWL